MPAMTKLPHPAADSAPDLKMRPIRSFVLRQGRVTKAQAQALELGRPKFAIDYAPGMIRVDFGWNGNYYYNLQDFMSSVYFKFYLFM